MAIPSLARVRVSPSLSGFSAVAVTGTGVVAGATSVAVGAIGVGVGLVGVGMAGAVVGEASGVVHPASKIRLIITSEGVLSQMRTRSAPFLCHLVARTRSRLPGSVRGTVGTIGSALFVVLVNRIAFHQVFGKRTSVDLRTGIRNRYARFFERSSTANLVELTRTRAPARARRRSAPSA